MACIVKGCHHSKRLPDKCSFFRFPLDESKKKKWIKLCRRPGRPERPNDRICSCHFKDEDKLNGPTIFKWDTRSIYVIKKKKRPQTRTPQEQRESEIDLTRPASIYEEHNYPIAIDYSKYQNQDIQTEPLTMDGAICLTARAKMVDKATMINSRIPTFSIHDIGDDPQRMNFYTSISLETFDKICRLVKSYEIKYYRDFQVTGISTENQLLMTLMKLKLNLKALDLADRFQTSRCTSTNVIKTMIYVLHVLLYEKNQLKSAPDLKTKDKQCKHTETVNEDSQNDESRTEKIDKTDDIFDGDFINKNLRKYEVLVNVPESLKSMSGKVFRVCYCLYNTTLTPRAPRSKNKKEVKASSMIGEKGNNSTFSCYSVVSDQ